MGKPVRHRAAVTLADAQLTLAALATLPTDSARAGIEALIELCERYGLRRIDEVVSTWSERRGTPLSPR